MKQRAGRHPTNWRWAVAVATFVALIVVGEISLTEENRPLELGLRAERSGDRLVVAWSYPRGVAWDAGVRPGDVVLTIDGRPASGDDPPGAVSTARRLEVRAADGSTLAVSSDAPAILPAPLRWSFLFLAAAFAIVGGAVFVLSVDFLAATVTLALATAAATALLAGIATAERATWALGLEYVAVVASGACILLLFLVFPINRLASRLGRWAAFGCLAVHAALVLLYGWVVAVDTDGYWQLQRLTFAVLGTDLAGASALVVLAWHQTSPHTPEARRALALVVLGTLGGLAPFGLLFLLPNVLARPSLLPPEVAILSGVLLPTSLGAAVLSRQFLGVTRLVRRGLVALVVWMALLAVYAVVLDGLRYWIAGSELLTGTLLTSTAVRVAVIAATFPFVQGRLRQALERILFRDVYGYAETLQQLSDEVVHLRDVETIAGHVLHRLSQTLDLSWAVIALRADEPLVFRYPSGHGPTDPERLLETEPGRGPDREASARTVRDVAQIVPLVAEGNTIGTLAVGPKRRDVDLLPEDQALLATLAPLVATALQNALLVRQLQSKVAALGERERALAALSARLMQVQEEERRRLALDLHDDPLQRAILLARELGDARDDGPARSWRRAVDEIIVSLRAICTGLRPPVLDDFGLVAGLEWLVNDLRARSDLTASLQVESANGSAFDRFAPDLELALYRVAQEALNNCVKHARATTVTVALYRDDTRIRLQVVDDGQGFGHSGEPDRRSLHLGILGMRERLRPWEGKVTVEANPSGGTTVTAEVLLGGEDARAS